MWVVEVAGWAAGAVVAAAERYRHYTVGEVGLVGAWGRWRRRGLGGRRARCYKDRWVGVVGQGSSSMLRALADRNKCSVGGGRFGVGVGRERHG